VLKHSDEVYITKEISEIYNEQCYKLEGILRYDLCVGLLKDKITEGNALALLKVPPIPLLHVARVC
jgi:hypothetical protein